MGELRRHKALLGWVATVALIGNIIASAFCCSPSQSADSPMFGGAFGKVVICTADGVKTFLPDGTGDHDIPGTSKAHCTLCVLAAGFALIFAAALLGLLTQLIGKSQPWPPRNRLTFEDINPSGPTSRGPPAFARR